MKIKKIFPDWVWLVYLLFFIFSIPWYLPKSLEMQLVLGLPLWLISCITAVFLTSCFTLIIIYKYWTD